MAAPPLTAAGLDVRPLPGGALVQDRDVVRETRADWKVVSSREPTAQEWADLELAWTISWRAALNNIVSLRQGCGDGGRAPGDNASTRRGSPCARPTNGRDAVMASDAFFPFPDALEVAADAGVTAVIHPGGSKGDEDVLAAAEARGMAVVLTGTRHSVTGRCWAPVKGLR